MNRQQRREMERQASEYEKRNTFSKAELVYSNNRAYEMGVLHALEAASMKCGIGLTRQLRIKEGIETLQALDFGKFEQTGNPYQLRLNREQRRQIKKEEGKNDG